MARRPVILAAFANTPDLSGGLLGNLSQEQKDIRDAFFREDGPYEVVTLHDATADDLWRYVRQLRGRLVAFHFGGHAGDEEIILSDTQGHGEETHVSSIAGLLGTCPHLRLIFLNGCATAGQVKRLQSVAGVPHLIATHAKVRDDLAALMAQEFYRNLAQGTEVTIATAFTTAQARVAQVDPSVAQRMLRDRMSLLNEIEEERFEWGLFSVVEAADQRLVEAEFYHLSPQQRLQRWGLALIGLAVAIGLSWGAYQWAEAKAQPFALSLYLEPAEAVAGREVQLRLGGYRLPPQPVDIQGQVRWEEIPADHRTDSIDLLLGDLPYRVAQQSAHLPSQSNRITVQLRPNPTQLYGTITWADGRPAAGVQLNFEGGMMVDSTDAQGNFSTQIPIVRGKTVRLSVRYQKREVSIQTLTLDDRYAQTLQLPQRP